MVETCGSVSWRAFLLKTPSVFVMLTIEPPVILLCCVYLKSARLKPHIASNVSGRHLVNRIYSPRVSCKRIPADFRPCSLDRLELNLARVLLPCYDGNGLPLRLASIHFLLTSPFVV